MPTGQGVHAVSKAACPAAPPMKPAGQVKVQAPCPGRPVYEAGAQGWQASGDVCPTSGLAVPGAHAVQAADSPTSASMHATPALYLPLHDQARLNA